MATRHAAPAHPQPVARYASVCFDVDSTLSAIEGIDWLAAQRGDDVARMCMDLTAQAMAGDVSLDAVYQRRLDAIRPTAADMTALATAYRHALEPGAPELLATLHAAGVQVHLISGGLREAILPLAHDLGVAPDHVHAVGLTADVQGHFVQLAGGAQPLATHAGKPHVIRALQLPRPCVMVGDGATDAATRPEVDAFIAYTGVARRPAVVAQASAEAEHMDALRTLLFT